MSPNSVGKIEKDRRGRRHNDNTDLCCNSLIVTPTAQSQAKFILRKVIQNVENIKVLITEEKLKYLGNLPQLKKF